MPFFVASTGSPSKYAARCSNSVKSSTLESERQAELHEVSPSVLSRDFRAAWHAHAAYVPR